ncbi:peptide chain release factor 3 [Sphingopyxis macrogoltabida]|jgi:peptide chain release factor 3|uniref:Peptide chain release factor 3 n=1 Tax=Sphingopyxis macrogoltabida TaxID=33050 RepID=A0A0N9UCI2_SPHMC|nr:peptide chain release factor 3 [Sphingopyxis macrogoltabida]ALH83148.1 peptide chain release factor 3 [Sphingopyxis macrogoltabida]
MLIDHQASAVTIDAEDRTVAADALPRRTFAIISHPDAGKTTLTEKLLHEGGAIREAGEVFSKGNRRRARSDWMAIEQQRGISVTSSVMTFEHQGIRFNLLDTPGHEDFSEDTYRTLTAVDCAVMVIDAAKGIEAQTLKLFEVCRLRSIPIITFINKIDREGRSPFELLDELADKLALDTSPMSWPIGMGGMFRGLYSFEERRAWLVDKVGGALCPTIIDDARLDDDRLLAAISSHTRDSLLEDAALAAEACPAFDRTAFLSGDMTPVYFGSALRKYGIASLLSALARHAPPPQPQPALPEPVEPDASDVAGFVFKMQANMDPNHRDRVAFMRVCSGTLKRGMKLGNSRTGKTIGLHNPIFFLARDRELTEEARPGDIIGIPNHGTLRVGDTLSERSGLAFTGLPDFAPEILRRVRLDDPMKIKQMRKALLDLAEEGIARVFRPLEGSNWVVGVVGALQLEVISTRSEAEYGLPISFEATAYETARWIDIADEPMRKRFIASQRANLAEDGDDALVFLSRNSWELERVQREWPEVSFSAVRERIRPAEARQ